VLNSKSFSNSSPVNNHVTAVYSVSKNTAPVAINDRVSLSFDKTPTRISEYTQMLNILFNDI